MVVSPNTKINIIVLYEVTSQGANEWRLWLATNFTHTFWASYVLNMQPCNTTINIHEKNNRLLIYNNSTTTTPQLYILSKGF